MSGTTITISTLLIIIACIIWDASFEHKATAAIKQLEILFVAKESFAFIWLGAGYGGQQDRPSIIQR